MTVKKYEIGHYIYHSFGEAVNHCIREGININSITMKEQETVAEYEKRTGVNYGCAPCDHLGNGCQGAKPGAFYYPNECPNFYNEHEEEQKRAYEEDTLYGLFEEEEWY